MQAWKHGRVCPSAASSVGILSSTTFANSWNSCSCRSFTFAKRAPAAVDFWLLSGARILNLFWGISVRRGLEGNRQKFIFQFSRYSRPWNKASEHEQRQHRAFLCSCLSQLKLCSRRPFLNREKPNRTQIRPCAKAPMPDRRSCHINKSSSEPLTDRYWSHFHWTP